MMFDYVPQRSAAKAAEAKIKCGSIKDRNGKHSDLSSPARSSAPHSPSLSRTTSDSSAPSSSVRTSPARENSLRRSKSRSHAEAPGVETSLSEPSDEEEVEERAVQLSFKSPSTESVSQSDARKKQSKKLASRLVDSKLPSPGTDENTFPEPASTTVRGSSKRRAAKEAKNNIQSSYSYFELDDLASPTQKKSRPSTSSSKAKSSHTPLEPSVSSLLNSDRKDVDGHRRASGASVPIRMPESRPKASLSSQPQKRGRRFQDDQGLLWELQFGVCQGSRYKLWRKCVQCIGKIAGDTCRFVGFRAFPVDPATDEPYVPDTSDSLKPAFISSPDSDEIMDLPTKRRLASRSLLEAQANVANSLLPVLEAELKHATQTSVLRRSRETTCRQMCEFCATSIFSASWFCRRCGREYCPDCKDAIEQAGKSEPSLAKRLTQCDRVRPHNVIDLIPLTRFDATLLEQEVLAMRGMLADNKHQTNGDSMHHPDSAAAITEHPHTDSSEEKEPAFRWRDIPQHQAGLKADSIIGSLSLRTFEGFSFDADIFRREWAHGEPLLVRNVISAMQHPWGPDELTTRYGKESCLIVRSDTDPPITEEILVGEFFSTFGKDHSSKEAVLGKGSWKLKDWPPSAEFKHEFPELYEDFNRAVPAPEYTTREGVLNLGSCYPAGVIQPDLGPKMYNAWPASEGVGGQGTTRLHMDIADAVNIMLYAAPPSGEDVPEEHRAGVAAWDIFRAEDADTLRAFLREEHAKMNFKDDPIHIQRFFISAPQRVKLFKKYGVKSWRIYQKAGEAVFIPAGCAHQVCNLTDCVKVAVDFVSPQNVERCFKLTAEFRELVKDYKKAWKEDVLSLRTTLWYAWCTYREMDNKGPNVWAKEQERIKTEVGARITRKVLQDAA